MLAISPHCAALLSRVESCLLVQRVGAGCATLSAVKSFAATSPSVLKRHVAVIVVAATWVLGDFPLHAADSHSPSITVRFEPVMVNGRNAFHVIESFRVQQPDTEIVIPTHWGSATHLEDQTQNLKIDSLGATIPKSSPRILIHPGRT